MTVLTIYPTASNHDGYEPSVVLDVVLTGSVYINNTTHVAGLFVYNVALAAADTVNTATLNYRPSSNFWDDPDVNWYGADVDSASVLVTTPSSIRDLTRTTAVVQDTATGIGTGYHSVDVKTIVQEVQGRAGWASGQNMLLIGVPRSVNSAVRLNSYDSGVDLWYVQIDYTTGAGSGVAKKAHYYASRRG